MAVWRPFSLWPFQSAHAPRYQQGPTRLNLTLPHILKQWQAFRCRCIERPSIRVHSYISIGSQLHFSYLQFVFKISSNKVDEIAVGCKTAKHLQTMTSNSALTRTSSSGANFCVFKSFDILFEKRVSWSADVPCEVRVKYEDVNSSNKHPHKSLQSYSMKLHKRATRWQNLKSKRYAKIPKQVIESTKQLMHQTTKSLPSQEY